MKKIVVVGGGAGGLELATKLGNTLGKKNARTSPLLTATPPTCGNRCCMK